MIRQFGRASIVTLLCLAMFLSLASAQNRGRRGGASRGGRSPGGSWSERSHGGRPSSEGRGNWQERSNSDGNRRSQEERGFSSRATSNRGRENENRNEQDAAATNRRNGSRATGENDRAAGAGAANRNESGNRNDAAGAAAVNRRNGTQATDAQSAAAGAAVSNRNSPQATDAQSAAAGAAVANRRSPQVSGAEGAAAGAAVANRNSYAATGAGRYAAVHASFDNPHMYGAHWYADHPAAWAPAAWPAGAAWAPVSWAAVAEHCGYGATAPVTYDYGNNVTNQDGNVSVGGTQVGTDEEYSQQAADLAEQGTEAEAAATDNWMPLGVFAMVRNEQQHPHLIMQLAINQQGVIRGNFTDEVSENVAPVHGSVDKQTQRAAWTVGDNRQTVMEAGLSNLTESAAPALIHKNGKTDHWLLVRLPDQQQDGNDAVAPEAGQ